MSRLGSFDFDLASLTLSRNGELVRAQRKTLELLAALVTADGALVSSTQLRERLWPSGAVEDRNLSQQAYLLRDVLAADPRVRLENVPRRGYRLIVPPPPKPAPVVSAAREMFAAASSWRFVRSVALGVCAIALAATAGFAAHPSVRPFDAHAQRAMDLGWLQWERRNPQGLTLARRYFVEVHQGAPDDARPLAALAAVAVIRGDESEGRTALPYFGQAAGLARAALARDPANAEAYDVLGLVTELRDHDSPAADALFRHAQMLDGSNAYAHIWRGVELFHTGALENALAELNTGEALAPASKTAARWVGLTQYERRSFEAAAEQLRTVLEIDPNDMEAQLYQAQLDEAQGRYRSALAKLSNPNIAKGKRFVAIARIEALSGHRDLARRLLARLGPAPHVDAVELAAAQLAIGDRDAALRTLAHQPAAERPETAQSLRWDVRYAALARVAHDADIN